MEIRYVFAALTIMQMPMKTEGAYCFLKQPRLEENVNIQPLADWK